MPIWVAKHLNHKVQLVGDNFRVYTGILRVEYADMVHDSFSVYKA